MYGIVCRYVTHSGIAVTNSCSCLAHCYSEYYQLIKIAQLHWIRMIVGVYVCVFVILLVSHGVVMVLIELLMTAFLLVCAKCHSSRLTRND